MNVSQLTVLATQMSFSLPVCYMTSGHLHGKFLVSCPFINFVQFLKTEIEMILFQFLDSYWFMMLSRKSSPVVCYRFIRSAQACTLCSLWSCIRIHGTHLAFLFSWFFTFGFTFTHNFQVFIAWPSQIICSTHFSFFTITAVWEQPVQTSTTISAMPNPPPHCSYWLPCPHKRSSNVENVIVCNVLYIKEQNNIPLFHTSVSPSFLQTYMALSPDMCWNLQDISSSL